MSKPKMATAVEKLVDALDYLQSLQHEHDEASAQDGAARRRATDAVNALNRQQCVVDELIADVRNAGSGDWQRSRHRADAQ